SDRLRHIHKLQGLMPDVTRNTFELRGLRKNDAREAIVEPARLKGDFASKQFEYDEALREEIVESLIAGGESGAVVELIDLQIICSHIERTAVIGQKKTRITSADIPTLSDIRKGWYQEILGQLKAHQRELAEELVEEKLIGGNPPNRISVAEHELENYRDILPKLTQTGLIRREEFKVGGFYYFISHDRLVEPILEARKDRLAVHQHLTDREHQQKQMRRFRALRTRAIDQKKSGDFKAAQETYFEALTILNDLPNAIRLRWDVLFQLGKIALSEEDYDQAMQCNEQALTIAKESEDVLATARSLEQIGSIHLIIAYRTSYSTPVRGESHKKQVSRSAKDAYRFYRKAANAYQECGEFLHYARMHEEIADNFEHLKFDERIKYYQTAKDQYERLGEPIQAAKINPKMHKLQLEAENVQKSAPDSVLKDLLDLTISTFRSRQQSATWGYLTDLLTGTIHELNKPTMHVGRSTDRVKNDVDIRSQTVSRNHLSIQNDLSIQDKRSLNGSSINGVTLSFEQRKVLQDGDLVIMADHYPLLFSIDKREPPDVPADAWGMIASDGIPGNYVLLGEDHYTVGFDRLAGGNGSSGYRLAVTPGAGENWPIRIKVDSETGGSQMYYDNLVMDGDWQVLFTLVKMPDYERQSDYEYKQYMLTPRTWGPSVHVPLSFVKVGERVFVTNDGEEVVRKEIQDGPIPFQHIAMRRDILL
ncbi:MAG: FHA domain-containing protein, partial [Saprospiraceae bacterium]|nr:FHA domain-containing protein [Saprospiraceae bacterium]